MCRNEKMKKIVLTLVAIAMVACLAKTENARVFIRKLIALGFLKKLVFSLFGLLMSVGVCAQRDGGSLAAATTYPFKSGINGLWKYSSSANIYYIVGVNYCASNANTTYEQMGIFNA